MALTWDVHCAQCHEAFQIYDDEAFWLMTHHQKPFCSDKCAEEHKKGKEDASFSR
jgi:endogenous inhibitor of DNA gyrase (YacG/DUF329 family)